MLGPVTLGVAYTDTDIGVRESLYLYPNFSSTKTGKTIAGPQVLFSITAAFLIIGRPCSRPLSEGAVG